MTLHMKQGGEWKEIQSFHTKINGEWKEISDLYKKENNVWVTVYSSGALLEFSNYKYNIPVMAGWEYKRLSYSISLRNIIQDSSFENNQWTMVSGSVSYDTDSFDGSRSLSMGTGQARISVETPIVGHSYYARRYIKTTGNATATDDRCEIFAGDGEGLNWVIAHNSGSFQEWTMQSNKWTVNSVNADSYHLRTFRVSANSVTVKQDGLMLIDLTEAFGAGNEPTQEWCDNNIPYFDGNGECVISGTDGWVTVTTDGEISVDSSWSGYVKTKGELKLNDYYNEVTQTGDYGERSDGTPLSDGRQRLTSFVLNSKGYVCGGADRYGDGYYSTVDVYDSSGNRTTGNSLSVQRSYIKSFVNSNKGYVCGGYNGSGRTNVDVYDSSGNRTTGNSLSEGRYLHTAFTNGVKSYVCGGFGTNGETASVEIYDSSGNRTSGTSLSGNRDNLTSFVNGGKGYVCGGHKAYNQTYYSNVDVYDSSGNRTTGTSLSSNRSQIQSFVNANKGYVCGGLENTHKWPCGVVDVYDSSGNRTTGTKLNVYRNGHTCFVNGNRGYVCGGETYDGGWQYTDSVEVYDSSGNKTFGNLLSAKRRDLTSFAINNRGYVCGGYGYVSGYYAYNTVDIYSDTYELVYKAHIPITQGSRNTLNGVSGTGNTSGILHYNGKVTGTIRYKAGSVPNVSGRP